MTEHFALSCPALGACRVVRVRGLEAMNALPAWTVDVISSDAEIDLDALVREAATLTLSDAHDHQVRDIPLLVMHASYGGPYRDEHRYTIELSAGPWLLGLRRGYRIFQGKTTQEIVGEVLHDAGVPASEIAWRLAGRYARRVQCVQYDETEWGFVERLLADEGISYWFEALDGEPRVLFGDSAQAHEGISGEVRVPFVDASGMSSGVASFFALSRAEEMAHDAAHLRDYDVRHPDVLIEGRAGDGALEHFEYPASVPSAESAQARAVVRLEQLQRFAISARGESDCPRLQPGRVVQIDGTIDDEFRGPWLIVEVEHAFEAASDNTGASRAYRNRVLLVPREVDGKERCFRPALPFARPRIEGIETAVVTGPAGEEIHVDDLGCVKLALRWDPTDTRNETSSRWARTLQMNMGGAMALPRVGWEVAVGYLDGNPDEPVVLGQVYNAETAPPYPLPASKATSAFRSATSPRDGSTNEIRFNDTKGAEELFVHASNTHGISVGASASTRVGVNETHDVHGGYGVHVKSQGITVGASQHVDVGSDVQTLVKGSRSEVIGAVDDIGVKPTRLVKVGCYNEVIGALYGLQCNETATTVQGGYLELVGGNLAAIAGLGTHESVADTRVELVAGARNVVAGRGYEDEVLGAKAVSAGAVRETSAANIETSAAAGNIKVGASASLTAGGKIQIEAATISLKVAGSLKVSAGASAKVAGKLQADGGKTKLDASVTRRKATSKVGA